MLEEIKLLPCPNPKCTNSDPQVLAGVTYVVKCHGCYKVKIQCCESKEEAIFLWNHIAAPAPLIQQLMQNIESMTQTNKAILKKVQQLVEALEEMIWQYCSNNGKIYHDFMSAPQNAFDLLGLENGMTEEEMEKALQAWKEGKRCLELVAR